MEVNFASMKDGGRFHGSRWELPWKLIYYHGSSGGFHGADRNFHGRRLKNQIMWKNGCTWHSHPGGSGG